MRQALCPYFGVCGGCSAQHVEYELQLSNKKKNTSTLLSIPEEEIKVFFDKEYFYRNRMDFIFHKTGVGFREKGKWDKIVDIEKCVIANEKLNELLKEVREFFKDVDAFDLKRQIGAFKYCVIRTPKNDSSITFVLNEDSTKLSEASERIEEFSKKTSAKNVLTAYVSAKLDESISQEFALIKGDEYLHENILDKNFEYHTQGFFQNNTIMAEKMVEYVKYIMKEKKGHLLDLYGGVGLFGVSVAKYFDSVNIVENWEASIKSANNNISSNNLENASAHVMDAKSIAKLGLKKPLHVITDPPRSGMSQQAIDKLLAHRPESIVYISYNPQQLSKELPRFLKSGYKIKSTALFDLFPQTNHFEVVLEMEV